MKVVTTADWHGELPGDSVSALPEGDVLVIAGDVMPVWNHGRQYQADWFRRHFLPHVDRLPYEDIIFIGGNHDFVLQDSPRLTADLPAGIHYLQDACVHIDGVCFYGTPWTPHFGHWAFMDDEAGLIDRFDSIPADTDVLISHGPPHGILDLTQEGVLAGSYALLRAIDTVRPWHVVCGHIHEGYGMEVLDHPDTTVHNVSLMTRNYMPLNGGTGVRVLRNVVVGA